MTKKQKISLGIVSVLLSAVLAASGFMIYRELSSQQKEKEDFKELAELITVTQPEPPESTEMEDTSTPIEETAEPEKPQESTGRDLTKLFAINDECIGWICIPGTAVDYPVMYTPDNPQKYLRKNFHGKYSQSGVPFLDDRCCAYSDNLIIYGHNMKNGTMFSNLRYYTDKTFCAEHPMIELETADGLNLCEIFAILKTDNADEWYNFIMADGKDDFNRRVSDVKVRSLFKSDIIPEYGQRIVSLSTCYGSSKSGRLLVLAVIR